MENNDNKRIEVKDQQSLIHLGSLDSFDITIGGKRCAKYILNYLKTGKKNELIKAIHVYEQIIPNENFGGEYTALEWVCKYFLASEVAKEEMIKPPAVKSFMNMMKKNNYDNLITYLKYKYHIVEYGEGDNTDLKKRMRFLEDFILFNNPDRERWETTRQNLEKFEIKQGMSIADVGCGPGYYSFKFADLVGDYGKVYAIETNPRHLEYLNEFVKENNYSNVEVVTSSFEGIGLDSSIAVDFVYICSLYHNVYAAFTDAERNKFVYSIRNALRNGGRLIIVDNDLVQGENLPYHGPYINKELIIKQLWHYGFKLRDSFQFTPQRYVLIFDIIDIPEKEDISKADKNKGIIVNSSASLVRYRIIGTSTSGYTKRGKICGRLMYEGFLNNDKELLKKAYDGFKELWPKERIGDDYTALMWFIEYKLADNTKREEMLTDNLNSYYANFFCKNSYERLMKYLLYKFHLELPDPIDSSEDTNFEYTGKDFPIPTLNEWNEFMVFNNPNRYLWEHTNEMCNFFNIKEGEKVADIGCGGGFFSWRFSQMVGETGKVYSTEINKDALHFLDEFIKKYNIKNIETKVTKMNDAGLKANSVDTIFMCSLYHAVYITNIEFVKDAFIKTVHKALKKGGRVIIVDNNVTDEETANYYGPGIHPQLIVEQMRYYGFILMDTFEVIPQRYALIFKEDEDYTMPPKGGKDKFGKDKICRVLPTKARVKVPLPFPEE